MITVLLLFAVVVTVLLSAFFSGSETGVYRFSRFHLRIGVQQRKPFFSLLSNVLSDARGYILTVLIGNNMVNYAATSIVTYMFLRQTGSDRAAELSATVIMTPVLFLFGEIIPKSIYYLHADTLLPAVAPLMWFFHRLFSRIGTFAVLKWMADALSRLFHLPSDAAEVITAGHRTQIKQIINETRDEGIVSAFQKDIMDRAVDIPAVPVQAVMVPVSQAVMVDVDTGAEALREVLKTSTYTRLPVFEKDRNHIVGFVNIYHALARDESFGDLRGLIRPIGRLRPTTSVLDAITLMRKGNYRMMVVAAPHREGRPEEKVLGIVTMKDLIEELTGELTPW